MLNLSYPASRSFVFVTSIIGIIASVLLSVWSVTIDDVINNDGIEYIKAAELWSIGDWRSAIAVWKWPLYPWLIMFVGDNLGIHYKTAGHFLNTIFFSLVVVFFVYTVRSFGGRSRLVTLMALLIALLHPAFNEYRAFLIRDPGYLAAYLCAVYSFVQYRWTQRLRYSITAIVSLLIASLFRVEGLVFLFAVPVLLLISYSGSSKWPWLRYLASLFLILVLGVALGGWFMVTSDGPVGLLVVEDPINVFSEGWEQIRAVVTEKLVILQEEFLGPYSAGYAYLLFALTVVTVIGSSIASELAIPYVVLIGYGIYKHALVSDQQLHRLWFGLIMINGAILAVFALIMLFLAPRYPLAMAITLLIAVPFVFERLMKDIQHKQVTKFGWVIVIICVTWALGESYSGVSNFSRNSHLRDAGYWLYEKTKNTSGPILTNNRRIAYYANVRGRREVIILDDQMVLAEFADLIEEFGSDFAGVRIQRSDSRFESQLNQAIKSNPTAVLDNGHGDRVLLYDVR